MIIESLSHDEWADDFEKYIRPVVNTFSDIASYCEINVLPVRQFLASHHLTVLREGWMVEPYIYHYTIVKNPGRWGMRALQLLEAARFYHDMSPIHNGPVYAQNTSDTDTSSVGFVWSEKPTSIYLKVFQKIFWLLKLLPTISNGNKLKQQKAIQKLSLWLSHNSRLQLKK